MCDTRRAKRYRQGMGKPVSDTRRVKRYRQGMGKPVSDTRKVSDTSARALVD